MGGEQRIRYLETLDRVQRAAVASDDLLVAAGAILQAVLESGLAERASLLHLADLHASGCTLYALEGTRRVPDSPGLREWVAQARSSFEPVTGGAEGVGGGLACLAGSFLLVLENPSEGAPALLGELSRRLAPSLGRLLRLRRLSERESYLAQVQRVAQIGYWERDLVDDHLIWSDSTYELLGLTPTGKPALADFLDLIHPEDRPRVVEAVERTLRGEADYDLRYRVVRADGEVRRLHSVGEVMRDAAGRASRFFGVFQDVTESERAADELRLFRTLVDHAHDAIEVVDPVTGRFLDVNRKACELHGYTREEYLSLTVPDIDPEVAAQPWEQVVARKRALGSYMFESAHRRKDGSVFPVEVNVTTVQLDRVYWLAVVRDITERRRVNQALKESHSLLQAVVEGTSDAVFVKDLEGRYVMINRAGAAVLGRTVEEVLGRNDTELLGSEAALSILEWDRRTLLTGEPSTFEEVLALPGGPRTFLATKGVYRNEQGDIIGLVGLARDVSELKRLEAQFRQAQKMEAVGQLAGGIAHDFNNLLTVINTYSEMLLESLAADDPRRDMLIDVRAAGLRAATLTRQLLAYSRKQVLQPKVVDLNLLLARLVQLLQRMIGEDIEVSLELEPQLGLTRVDESHFEQAIINLAVNARDAMPEGGTLVLRTSRDLESQDYVSVSVADSGHGIDESVRAHLFEPFFTTKGLGRGTGLGLAMVYGFVTQSGGHLEVQSEPGRGATFTIYLPVVQAESAPETSGSPAGKSLAGTETILLVEDEPAVRRLASQILRKCGYQLVEASDGEEALLLAQKHSGPLHLVVTDVVMPRMSGRHLAEKLLHLYPGLQVLYISGYPIGELTDPGDAYLQKPFSATELCECVRELLDRR